MNFRKIIFEAVDNDRLKNIVLNVLGNIGTVGSFKVERMTRAQQTPEISEGMFRMTFTARPMKVKVKDWMALLSKENPKYKRLFKGMPTSQLTLATLLDFEKNTNPTTPREREIMSATMKLYQRAQQQFIAEIRRQIVDQVGPAFTVVLNAYDFKETGKQLRTDYEIIILEGEDTFEAQGGMSGMQGLGTGTPAPTPVTPPTVTPAKPKKKATPRRTKPPVAPTQPGRKSKHQMTPEETTVLLSAIETTIGSELVSRNPSEGAGVYYTLRDKSMTSGSKVTFVTDSYYRQETLPMFMGYYTIDGGKTHNKSKWNEMMGGIQQFYQQEKAKQKGVAEPVQRDKKMKKSRNSRFGGLIGNKLRRLVSNSQANDEILIYAEMNPKLNPFTKKAYPWGGTVVFHIFEIAPLGEK